MKKIALLLMSSMFLMLVSCSTGSNVSYNQNTGMKSKKVDTVARVKGGSKAFCHH
jgi:hypothetical protein